MSRLTFPASTVELLVEWIGLKQVPRAGWQRRGISDPESVADHSWATALLVLLFAETAGVDQQRALQMAVIHDLAEVYVGDLPYTDDPEQQRVKAQTESAAIETLGVNALNPKVTALWREYEAATTTAARFVRDMNLIEMALQAIRYEGQPGLTNPGRSAPAKETLDLEEFVRSAEARLCTDFGRSLFKNVAARYQALHESANG